MGLETGTYVSDLDVANPVGATDKRHQGDNHLRLIKSVLKTTFPNASKPFRFPNLLTKTADYTILSSDANALILCDTSGGEIDLTLPTLASGDAGYEIRITKSTTDTSAIVVVGTINGETNMTINNRYEVLTVFWTGAAWLGFVDQLGYRVALVTDNLTVTEDHLDGVILSTPTGANKTLTLPAIANYRGRTLTVHHTGATYKTTLDGNGSETINGATTLDLTVTNMVVTIMAMATGWIVISQIGAATSNASAADVITATDTSKLVTPASLAPLVLKGTDIASASTITIPDTGNFFHVTGTTTISDIDFTTTVAGRRVTLVFDGVLTLTHNATTLILQTGANITTAAGDMAEVICEGGDNVRVNFFRASGKPVGSSGGLEVLAIGMTHSTVDIVLGAVYEELFVDINFYGSFGCLASVSVSDDGSTFGTSVTAGLGSASSSNDRGVVRITGTGVVGNKTLAGYRIQTTTVIALSATDSTEIGVTHSLRIYADANPAIGYTVYGKRL